MYFIGLFDLENPTIDSNIDALEGIVHEIDLIYQFDVKHDALTWRRASCVELTYLNCCVLDSWTLKIPKSTPKSMFYDLNFL